MKGLRISRLCVVVAMVFGLFAAWSAAVPKQLSTSQELAASDGAVTGGCGDNEQCVVPGSRDCSDPYTGGDSSCTGWHLPWCYDAGMGETEWACVIKGYYCDGPSPTCDLKTVTCVEQ